MDIIPKYHHPYPYARCSFSIRPTHIPFCLQRVRFCKAHIRCPQFLYQELPSRFCQKCGRVQPLADFDGLKKSCRDSLKKHNEKQRALRSQRASYWAQLSKSADYADSFADGGVASNSCTHSEESELAVATPTTTLSLSWLENSLEVGPQAPRVAALSATPPLGPPRHQTGPLPAKISKPPSNNSVVDEHERTLPEPMSFDEFVNELLSEVYCLRQTDSGALPPAVQLPYLI